MARRLFHWRAIICLIALLGSMTDVSAGILVIFNRPLARVDASPIDAAEPLRYRVYTGADRATLTQLHETGANTDALIVIRFTASDIPVGQTLCVSTIAQSDETTLESAKVCGVYSPTGTVHNLFIAGE